MRLVWRIIGCAAISAIANAANAQDVSVDIGDRQSVVELFSWPNCVAACSVERDLPETIEHYMRSSLKRDGFADTNVDASEKSGRVTVTFSGPAAARYAALLPSFLAAGKPGVTATDKLKAGGEWLGNWRFFLPLGLPMANNKTVQLLHFPPDYVLTKTQDYLDANTTRRWAAMLRMNGAAAQDVDRYQAIVDIAPIAAPANDGQKLDKVYDDYSPYSNAMLGFWLTDQSSGAKRPMVAFGAPVRHWLASEYGTALKVGDTTTIAVPGTGKISVIAANHPSMIYRSASSYEGPDGKPNAKGISRLTAVMGQDVVAACWQVRMAAQPTANGATVAAQCQAQWAPKRLELCKAALAQVYDMGPAEQASRCKIVTSPQFKLPGRRAIEKIERSLAF